MLRELPDAVLALLPRSGRPLNRWDDNGLFGGLTMRGRVGEVSALCMYPRIRFHIRKVYAGNGEDRVGAAFSSLSLALGTQARVCSESLYLLYTKPQRQEQEHCPHLVTPA